MEKNPDPERGTKKSRARLNAGKRQSQNIPLNATLISAQHGSTSLSVLFPFASREGNQFRDKTVWRWLCLVCRDVFCCITWKRSLNSWTWNCLNLSHILSFTDVAKCAEPAESSSLPRKRAREQLLPLSSCPWLWAGSVPPLHCRKVRGRAASNKGWQQPQPLVGTVQQHY